MYKGGQVNSPVSVIINETNNIYQVGFDKGASTLVHSPGDDDFNSEALSAQTNQHKIDFNTLGILNHNGIRRSWWGENQTDADGNLIGTAKPKPYALEHAYLGLIGYGSSNQLRLINYVYDPFLNIDYWYDAINLIKCAGGNKEARQMRVLQILIFNKMTMLVFGKTLMPLGLLHLLVASKE